MNIKIGKIQKKNIVINFNTIFPSNQTTSYNYSFYSQYNTDDVYIINNKKIYNSLF